MRKEYDSPIQARQVLRSIPPGPLALVAITSLIISGCAPKFKSGILRYKIELFSSATAKSAEVTQFKDDRKGSSTIGCCPRARFEDENWKEVLTARFAEDLRESQIFTEVSTSPSHADHILIPSVEQFGYVIRPSPICLVPGINLLCFFGIHFATYEAESKIAVEVREAASSRTIATIREGESISKDVNVYQAFGMTKRKFGDLLNKSLSGAMGKTKRSLHNLLR